MATPIILEVCNVSAPPRLRGQVSFTLREGERVCVYGHSGAGKTTLLRALLGLLAHRGSVVWHIPRASAGYAAQCPRLIPRANVLQQIIWCSALHGASLSVHGSRIHDLLEWWGLQAQRYRPVQHLSAGERLRLELCCATAVASRLLVVDGLLEQLDEHTRGRFWEEIDARCARRDLALIYATHSAREAELADQVLLLHEGRVLAMDTSERLRARAEVQPVYLEAVHDSSRATVQATLGQDGEVRLTIHPSPTMEDVLQALARRGGLE
jgi:ABC-type multidrug transport system ATPase subunit